MDGNVTGSLFAMIGVLEGVIGLVLIVVWFMVARDMLHKKAEALRETATVLPAKLIESQHTNAALESESWQEDDPSCHESYQAIDIVRAAAANCG